MKLQLDTDKKTIKIEENISLEKLFNTVKKLLPENLWKEYELQTNTIIQSWNNPIYITPHYDWTYRPYIQPYYGSTAGNTINCSQLAGTSITFQNNNIPNTLTSGSNYTVDIDAYEEKKNIFNFEIEN